MFRTLFITLLTISLALAAQSSYTSGNDAVNHFIEKHRNHTPSFHRAGADTSDKIFNLVAKNVQQNLPDDPDDISKYTSDVKTWSNSKVFEYDIIEREPNQLVGKITAAVARPYGLDSYIYDTTRNCAIFSSLTTTQDLITRHNQGGNPKLSLEQLENNANEFVLKNLPMLHGKIEFDNQEVTYLDKEILKCTFRYRRIFKGGVVLQSLSYINISIDEKGQLLSVEIRWPRFKKVNQPQATISVDTSISLLNSLLQENSKGRGANVKGASYAWMGIDGQKKGTIMLTPCFFYVSDVILEEGKVEKSYVPVPLIQKYSQE